jgi:hypothetical protein
MNWSSIVLDQLFIDYTLLDTAVFRIGKVGLSWGQGSIIANPGPGNFVELCGDGASIKMDLPILIGTLSTVVMASPSYFANGTAPGWNELGLAAIYEGTAGPVSFGVSGFYQKYNEPKADIYLKTNVFGIDLYTETVASFVASADVPRMYEISGFSWEGLDSHLTISGEYYYNGGKWVPTDHSMGLAVGYKNIAGTGMKVGVQWIHAFVDNSGNVTVGFETPLFENLTLSLALPVTYGESGSRYRSRSISLALQLKMEGSY